MAGAVRRRIRDPLALSLCGLTAAGLIASVLPSGTQARPATAAETGARAAALTARLVRPHFATPKLAPEHAPKPRAAKRQSARRLRPDVAAVAQRFGVPASVLRRVVRWAPLARAAWPGHASLVLAVCAVESGGTPDLYTPAPDGLWSAGLLQVASEWWSAYGMTWGTAITPSANVRAGAAILRADVRQYGEWDGLQAYNAGPAGVGSDQGYAAAVWSWLPAMRAVLAP